MKSSIAGHFIPSSRGNVFLLLRRPARPSHSPCRCVLVVPPFGEELNKSRKLVTDFSVGLAGAGMAAAVVDLYGTGDSEGVLQQADWATWRADVSAALNWLIEGGLTIMGLLGIRLGCTLAAECAQKTGLRLESSVFWQPMASGRQMVDATLRLRTAATLLRSDRRETVQALRSRLARGEVVEAGGYALSPHLVDSMDAVQLANIDPVPMGRISWIELGRSNTNTLSMDSMQQIRVLQDRGGSIIPRQIEGQPFWMSAETVTIPELVELSVSSFVARP